MVGQVGTAHRFASPLPSNRTVGSPTSGFHRIIISSALRFVPPTPASSEVMTAIGGVPPSLIWGSSVLCAAAPIKRRTDCVRLAYPPCLSAPRHVAFQGVRDLFAIDVAGQAFDLQLRPSTRPCMEVQRPDEPSPKDRFDQHPLVRRRRLGRGPVPRLRAWAKVADTHRASSR